MPFELIPPRNSRVRGSAGWDRLMERPDRTGINVLRGHNPATGRGAPWPVALRLCGVRTRDSARTDCRTLRCRDATSAHRRSSISTSTGHLLNLSLWLLADIFSSAPDPNMWKARALCSAQALEGPTCQLRMAQTRRAFDHRHEHQPQHRAHRPSEA